MSRSDKFGLVNITTVSPAQVYAGTAHTTDTSRTDISAVAGRNTRCGAVDGKVECIVISTVDIQYLHIYYLVSPVQVARVACCGETPATVVLLVADTGAGEAGLHIGGVEVRVSVALHGSAKTRQYRSCMSRQTVKATV